MSVDKASVARERILDLLDSGSFAAGDRLPGAREIAEDTGVSLLTAQAAIKTLERDGILELRPRSGAFVKEGWQEVAVESNFVHFDLELPWMGRFEALLKSRLPSVRLAKAFRKGVIEMRTTITLQSNRHDYIDMDGIFRDAWPDDSPFFSAPFKGFRQNGKLLGVPFIFSPRAIVYNPEVFKKRGCKEPQAGWTWDEFLGSIKALREAGHPKDRIFNLNSETTTWMSFVLLAGGSLFKPDDADPVKIDSPETRRGLRLYSEIQKELGLGSGSIVEGGAASLFIDESLAMTLMPREVRCWLSLAGFESWSAVPMPSLPGCSSSFSNTQATDLICVRRECRDKAFAAEFVRLALSEEFQDFIGGEKYGVPVRKSSAMKSLDRKRPGDKVFFEQIDAMSADYNFESPDIAAMLYEGIGAIWTQGAEIDATTAELASAIRTYLKVKSYAEKK